MKLARVLVISLVAMVLLMSVAVDAAYPERDIIFVTHSSPGGGSDVLARMIAIALENLTDATVTVENRTGGSGAVALTYMARVKPDGYTLMTVTPTQIITPLRSPGIPNYETMTPVARMFMDSGVLYVRKESPFQNLSDLIEFAKANPGKLTWGIGSAGSLDHLIAMQAQEELGIDFRIVPHEGGGDVKVSVLGGHVDVAMGEPQELLAQFDSGDVRALAAFTEERIGTLPEVPTMQELGYDVVYAKFRGVWGPPGMREELVQEVAAVLKQAYDVPRFKQYWSEGGLSPAFLAGNDFEQFLAKTNGSIKAFLDSLKN